MIKGLASHYDKAFASLGSIAGWRTNRKVRGKLVLGEMLRVKAFLVVERNTTRDYLDVAALDPYDLTDVDLTEYKGIIAPWDDWRAVEAQCRAVAEAILRA